MKVFEIFKGSFLFQKLFQDQFSLFFGESILISTSLSTSDIYRSLVINDFGRNSYKSGTEKFHSFTMDAAYLDKIAKIR